ncbi:hypothetical protein V7S43_002097 [Phytophthora oleae]|uniref:Uncharacterized protein n=1 Tax=Phytophthora oleae TaxID=2107226 RepID=A0ABD3G141_9STRA
MAIAIEQENDTTMHKTMSSYLCFKAAALLLEAVAEDRISACSVDNCYKLVVAAYWLVVAVSSKDVHSALAEHLTVELAVMVLRDFGKWLHVQYVGHGGATG